MNKKTKFFFIVLFVLLDIFLLIGYFVIREATMLNELKKEVLVLSSMDLSKDDYHRKMKTRGKYAEVEKAIKTYLEETSTLLQDTIDLTKDETFTQVLSYDNYVKDGPLFEESLSYVKTKKELFQKNMDTLLERLDESSIIDYGNEKIEDAAMRKLYLEALLSDEMKEEFQTTKELLQSNRVGIDRAFSVSQQVLEFLVLNQEQWEVEDGEIKFRTQALYDQYMTFINQLKVEEK